MQPRGEPMDTTNAPGNDYVAQQDAANAEADAAATTAADESTAGAAEPPKKRGRRRAKPSGDEKAPTGLNADRLHEQIEGEKGDQPTRFEPALDTNSDQAREKAIAAGFDQLKKLAEQRAEINAQASAVRKGLVARGLDLQGLNAAYAQWMKDADKRLAFDLTLVTARRAVGIALQESLDFTPPAPEDDDDESAEAAGETSSSEEGATIKH